MLVAKPPTTSLQRSAAQQQIVLLPHARTMIAAVSSWYPHHTMSCLCHACMLLCACVRRTRGCGCLKRTAGSPLSSRSRCLQTACCASLRQSTASGRTRSTTLMGSMHMMCGRWAGPADKQQHGEGGGAGAGGKASTCTHQSAQASQAAGECHSQPTHSAVLHCVCASCLLRPCHHMTACCCCAVCAPTQVLVPLSPSVFRGPDSSKQH